MAAATPGTSAASHLFQAELTKFKNRLSGEQLRSFKCTSLNDVKDAINEIQKRQEAKRELRNLTRIRGFLDAMEQFGNIIEVFNNTSDFVAFILEAYEQIGEALPLLEQYLSLFQQHPEMQRVLAMIYKDILEFHQPALRFLNRPGWRQLFRSAWGDFKTKLDGILRNLDRHRRLIESQFNLLQARQHEAHHTDLLNEIQNLEQQVRKAGDWLKSREESRKAEQLSGIRDWIAGNNTSDSHELALRDREDYAQTGLWITQNEKVSSWLTDDLPRSSILWMHGIPGAGKTILASIIIEACLKQQQSKTAYFYCRHDDIGTTNCVSILKGLLAQQIYWYPVLVPYFNEQRLQRGEAVLTFDKTAKNLFETVCEEGERQYIVLDGLDECRPEERKSILSFLTSLVTRIDGRNPSKLRVLIVSQEEPDIRRWLSSAEEFPLKREDNSQDIRTFVQARIAEIQRKFELSVEASNLLAEHTCRNAAGQFLFAKLVLEHLLSQLTVKHFEREVEAEHFPKKLEEAYDRIIERIKLRLHDHEWDFVQQFLGWMTCAARPLKWHEIQGAMAISVDEQEVDFQRRRIRETAQDLCGPLVTVYRDRVILVHSTAKRFIAVTKHVDLLAVESRFASLCLEYLAFPHFDGDVKVENVLNGSYAFADYAVAKWIYHFDKILGQFASQVDAMQSDTYEAVVQELCEAVENMVRECADDLRGSHAEAEASQLKARLKPEVCRLLTDFEGAEDGFQSLWHHVELHRTRDFDKRNEISLDRLKTAMASIRKLLEELSTDKGLRAEAHERLKSYYGSKFFRCSKTTCFYFHEGFTDGRTRDKHVGRHDRPYQCTAEDCDVADMGFGTKKELENHMHNFHPDAEMKAQIFKELKPATPSHAKFGCGQCGKSFVRKAILRDHELAHSGQKPFPCATCGKAFTRKNDCTRHEKIHLNRR
ncbi:NACHT domain-containing protein [Cladophialophora immunda]|nr:NACHT domain-containing protein [Cladophialophora immunda]